MARKEKTLAAILAILERQGHEWVGGVPPADLRVERTRAGRHQRSAGAWLWRLESDTSPLVYGVGSQYPATEVATWNPATARLHYASWGDVSLYPN